MQTYSFNCATLGASRFRMLHVISCYVGLSVLAARICTVTLIRATVVVSDDVTLVSRCALQTLTVPPPSLYVIGWGIVARCCRDSGGWKISSFCGCYV